MKIASLSSARLTLEPLDPADAPDIQLAASDRQIADTMVSLPYPYPDREAERYIARQQNEMACGGALNYVLRRRENRAFTGLIEIRQIDFEHSLAELSFWLASSAWGHGYMQEALKSVVEYGFETLDLNRLYAYHMLRNPASAGILEKIGFRQEGLLRQRVRKWGEFEDVALLAMLQQDWKSRKTSLARSDDSHG